MQVIIAGVSTRAAAESAARAGFRVTAVDAFGDLDQHRDVRSLSVPRDAGVPFTPEAAANLARGIACDAVVYLSNFENHPRAVSALAAGRQLWGNDPAVLKRVRNPALVSQVLCERGLAAPRVRLHESDMDGDDRHRRWLVKPRRSGGGDHIRPWQPGAAVAPTCYLQEDIEGTSGSIAFVAASGRATVLGFFRQLIGEHAFGADNYRYCGNVIANDRDDVFEEAVVNAATDIVRVIADAFALTGVNGVDVVVRDGVPYAVEVNPRWTASMELIEIAHGWSIFGAHAAAFARGELPPDPVHARRDSAAVGKAIIYAQQPVTLGDTCAWLGDPTIRDVPRPGERVEAGRPVCTVFASGRDAAECQRALIDRAEGIYAELDAWRSSCKAIASS